MSQPGDDLGPTLIVPTKDRAVPGATVTDWLIVFTHMGAYWRAIERGAPKARAPINA